MRKHRPGRKGRGGLSFVSRNRGDLRGAHRGNDFYPQVLWFTDDEHRMFARIVSSFVRYTALALGYRCAAACAAARRSEAGAWATTVRQRYPTIMVTRPNMIGFFTPFTSTIYRAYITRPAGPRSSRSRPRASHRSPACRESTSPGSLRSSSLEGPEQRGSCRR